MWTPFLTFDKLIILNELKLLYFILFACVFTFKDFSVSLDKQIKNKNINDK